MKKSELKALIKECLVEESKATITATDRDGNKYEIEILQEDEYTIQKLSCLKTK